MSLTVVFKRRSVSKADVLAALQRFDTDYARTRIYEGWWDKANFKYAVEYAGRRYPPKCVLRLAAGLEQGELVGGEGTNRVFRQLGFTVIQKP